MVKKVIKQYQGNEGSSETKKRNPPKVKTRTVTTNPGGYSKTIVKTKTVDRPGKQASVTTTKTRPTIKGVASDYASGVRKSVYDIKEKVSEKRTEIKNRRKKNGIPDPPIPKPGDTLQKSQQDNMKIGNEKMSDEERKRVLDSLRNIPTPSRDYSPNIKRPSKGDTTPGPTTPGQRINPNTMEIQMAPGEAKRGGTISTSMDKVQAYYKNKKR
jgi:hypothetical protein